MKVNTETVGVAAIFAILWIAASLAVVHVIKEQRREIRQQSVTISSVSNHLLGQDEVVRLYGTALNKIITELHTLNCMYTEVHNLNGMYIDLSNLTTIYTLPHDDESRSNQTAPPASSPVGP